MGIARIGESCDVQAQRISCVLMPWISRASHSLLTTVRRAVAPFIRSSLYSLHYGGTTGR